MDQEQVLDRGKNSIPISRETAKPMFLNVLVKLTVQHLQEPVWIGCFERLQQPGCVDSPAVRGISLFSQEADVPQADCFQAFAQIGLLQQPLRIASESHQQTVIFILCVHCPCLTGLNACRRRNEGVRDVIPLHRYRTVFKPDYVIGANHNARNLRRSVPKGFAPFIDVLFEAQRAIAQIFRLGYLTRHNPCTIVYSTASAPIHILTEFLETFGGTKWRIEWQQCMLVNQRIHCVSMAWAKSFY